MIKPELETLFYPFSSGAVAAAGQRALFLNAQAHPALAGFGDVVCQQYFKPYADDLELRGFNVVNEWGDDFDAVLVAVPKNMIEARALVARGMQALRPGGLLVVAADNKAGGGRLMKMLAGFGLTGQSESRNKCRVVWAEAYGFDPLSPKATARQVAVDEAISAGAQQSVLDGAFVSQPGVFGWDKVDAGSALLVEYFPDDFKGKGADFGCGYGYLSRAVMERGAAVKALYALDADARAVECTKINLCLPCESSLVEGIWADLTQDCKLRNLDFIVMNPPFHEGKAQKSDIGAAFIERAAQCLRRGGELWMVANAHLPYERVLSDCFFSHERLAQVGGFKVFRAVV